MRLFNVLKRQKRGYHTKQIGQYKNGVLIKKYNSICEVQRKKGYPKSHLVECCKGRRSTAYGYEWRYLGEE